MLPADQHLRHSLREENLPDTGQSLGFLQHQNGLVPEPLLREYRDDILRVQSVQRLFVMLPLKSLAIEVIRVS